VLAYYLAFLIRFDGVVPPEYAATMLVVLIFIPVKLACNAFFRLYHVTWSLVGLTEMIQVGKASTIATLFLTGGLLALRGVPTFGTFPRSVLVLDYLLSTAFIAFFRIFRRLLGEFANARFSQGDGIRVLLVGAGAAGERIARAMLNEGQRERTPVGFIDDDTAKHGAFIHGLRVFGGREVIPLAVGELNVEEVLITIPSAHAATIRDIVQHAREAGVKRIKVLPSISELLANKLTLQEIRDVDVEDLLGRESVQLDIERVHAFLDGRKVLVTGAAGSIGAELARQLSHADVAHLILLDNSESALFELEADLTRERVTSQLHFVIGDIRDAEKMDRLFGIWRPDVVYHAAAYKHVPLMEVNVDEAVRTNISGTLAMVEAALKHGSQTFVLISSDKAISPSNVMGATKRVAELVLNAFNGRRTTRFIAVRFGNVIGSRGSVIPVMRDQIRHGGPVTVTDPEMTRYFMSTREAVALVLQTSAMRDPHDIFMLDMGIPVKILELARELIWLSGFEPDKDIPIVFTGTRPGEKLHETLETPEEPLEPTEVPKIFAVNTNGRVDEITLRFALQELDRLSRAMDITGLRSILDRLTNGREQIPLWSAAHK